MADNEIKVVKNNKGAGNSANLKILIMAFCFLLIGLFLYFRWGLNTDASGDNSNKVSGFVNDGIRIQYDYGFVPDTFYSESGFFLCTKDGIKRYGLDGLSKWDMPLSLNNPKMIGEKNHVIVSEYKSKSFYVFSPTGKSYGIDGEDPILTYAINGAGRSVIMTLNKANDFDISIYTPEGERSSKAPWPGVDNYPFSMDISEDGRIIAISYVNTNSLRVSTSINFYYADKKEAESFVDGMFASSQVLEDQMIFKVNFVGENKLVYFSDLQIGAMETGANNHLKNLWFFELKNEISHTGFIGDKIIVVALSKPLVNKEGYKDGTLLFLSAETGQVLFEYDAKSSITYLSTNNNNAVIGCGNLGKDFIAFNKNGEILWEHSVMAENAQILTLDDSNKILYVTPLSLEIMKMGKINNIEIDSPINVPITDIIAPAQDTTAPAESADTPAEGNETVTPSP